MTLRMRLSLLFAIAVTAMVAAGGTLLVHQLSSGLATALDASLTARADALAQQVGPGGTVANFQDGAGNGPMLPANETLAQVVSPSGHLTESSEGTGGRPLLTAAQLMSAREGRVSINSDFGGGPGVRLLALPVADSGSPAAVVVVGTSRGLVLTAVSRVETDLWLGGPVVVLLGALGAWLLSGAVLLPIERMRAQAAEISAGDSDARLEVPRRRDEIARLGDTMNELLGRLQRALHQQRVFVADAGHELRTPLTMLHAELELAGRPGKDLDSLVAAVQAATLDTDRLIRLAENLLTLARTDSAEVAIQRQPVDLHRVVKEAVSAFDSASRKADVRVDADNLGEVMVIGDPARLRQVIDNVLDNALRYAAAGGSITVYLTAATRPAGAVLEILDRGPGFPPAFLPTAFDRFSRADGARTDDAGTGLGLAIVASLIDAHGGTVTARNRPGGGASICIELPADHIDNPDRQPGNSGVTSLAHRRHMRRAAR